MDKEQPREVASRLEQALIWYARHFPLSHGKLRMIDAVWHLAARGDPRRIADLIYGGFKAPCDLRDMLQRQFYFFGTYYLERNLLACWSRQAMQSPVVFDVGANAGIYSLAAMAENPHARVHAFEPTPEIADRLRTTAVLNGLAVLHVHEEAVADYEGRASLIRCRGGADNDGMNYIRSETDAEASELVSVCSLDAFCAQHGVARIDLMKMDIQGSEAAALRGAARLLREGRIGTLFIELNWGPEGATCPASQTVSLLVEHGFVFAKPAKKLKWRTEGPWLRELSDVIAQIPVKSAQ